MDRHRVFHGRLTRSVKHKILWSAPVEHLRRTDTTRPALGRVLKGQQRRQPPWPLVSGVGTRPVESFSVRWTDLSTSPLPLIPNPAVGGRFSDDGASGLSVVTGGAIPSHSGMSCSRCLQCGDVGSFPPPQSRTRSGQGRGSAPRHGVTLTARAVPRDRAPWRLHTLAPCRLEPRARLARASRL